MVSESATLKLAKALISRASVTPSDEGCQALIRQRLESTGFKVTSLNSSDVTNFWAVRGDTGPLLCFAGHTDVVPSGDISKWTSPPFQPAVRDGLLYGRGAADMKGSLAAMVVATEQFIASEPQHAGRIAFLITSDEEGAARDGTVKVVEWLKSQGTVPDWCVIGEPSSSNECGDVIKNGRRGSLNCEFLAQGRQGHVAYPELARNPIHQAIPALTRLTEEVWDNGNAAFPATQMQISNIQAGTGATNVIPGYLRADFNFRFSTAITAIEIQDRTRALLNAFNLDYQLTWTLSGEPFLTPKGTLITATEESVYAVTGRRPQLSTGGGTSDGRFIAPLGTQIIELGPVNASIHQVDEHVSIADLDVLTDIYETLLGNLLAKA